MIDPRLEILLKSADLSEEQQEALTAVWSSIKTKGQADSLTTQHAVFSYGLAVAMGGAVQEMDKQTKSMKALIKAQNKLSEALRAQEGEHVANIPETENQKTLEALLLRVGETNDQLSEMGGISWGRIWFLMLFVLALGLTGGILTQKYLWTF